MLCQIFAAAEDLRSFNKEDIESDAGKNRVFQLITNYLSDYVASVDTMHSSDEDLFNTPPLTKDEILNIHRDRGIEGNRRFAIGAARKEQMRQGLMTKLAGATEEKVEATIKAIEEMGERVKKGGDAKTEKVAFHWAQNGTIILPEDEPKVIQAIKVATIAKVDPMQYKSPMELINQHANIKLKEKPIAPDTVKELSNKTTLDYGITIYDVQDDEDGQKAMRKIINTHFGEDCSPWCLLQGDEKGGLSDSAWMYWNHYNSVQKRVAFKDGKLLAFCASDDGNNTWWDRADSPHDGIPISMKMPNDELGRTANYNYNVDSNELGNPTNIHKGNKENGEYKGWYSNEQIREHFFQKGGKLQGEYKLWRENGQMWIRSNYKDEKRNGLREVWNEYGQLKSRENYKDGKRNGLREVWNEYGQLKSRENYKDGKYDGLCEEWYYNGQLKERTNYKDGKLNGLCEVWNEYGQMRHRANYKDDKEIENLPLTDDRGERAPRQDERRWSVAREQAKDLTAPLGVSLQELKKALKALAGKDLKNDETGIVAQVNSVQSNKMSSNAAVRKSVDNGFTKEEHNAAASIIDKLWKHALLVVDREDKENDKNVKAVRRFVAPVFLGERMAYAYLTEKESVRNEQRIYSIELDELKNIEEKIENEKSSEGMLKGLNEKHPSSSEDVDRIAKFAERVKQASDEMKRERRYAIVGESRDDVYLQAVASGDIETAKRLVEERIQELGLKERFGDDYYKPDFGEYFNSKHFFLYANNKEKDVEARKYLRDANHIIPSKACDEILSWKRVSRSPYGDSFYNTFNKSWDNIPDKSLRLADHWNFESRNEIHCKTDIPVEKGHWILARYDKNKRCYKVLKDFGRNEYVKREAHWQSEKIRNEQYKKTTEAQANRWIEEQQIREKLLKEFGYSSRHKMNKEVRDRFDVALRKAYDELPKLNLQGKIVDDFVMVDGVPKSAAPIVYDDNGNVIPLSKRFDRSNNDIRYSIANPSALVDAMREKEEDANLPPVKEGWQRLRRRWSIGKFQDGTKFVNVDTDQNLFDGVEPKNYSKIAHNVIKDRFVGRVIGKYPNNAYVRSEDASEYAYPAKFLHDEKYQAKMRGATELNNLMLASTFIVHEDDKGTHPEAVGGWDYYNVIFTMGDKHFTGKLNIMNNKRGRIFHDMTNIKEIAVEDLMGKHGQIISSDSESQFPNDKNSIQQEAENRKAFALASNTSNNLYPQFVNTLSDEELIVAAVASKMALGTRLRGGSDPSARV